ncbi:metallophosphatase domain-containing protein [Christiangramia sp. SM2212]|uniref:Metallophosphatase domain-containing protein n=1 Tax=Christiangramia sediminicola TaxID=3073267 RepID=A0ABU1ELT7_9FLAO|nr:metallophosphatase domain-containing protein [Christiangramia sp. SM2212]MDR5589353.1 metallophosphatase domain-containing protein [Christiangramia sp. SM2212]
MRLVCLSDTHNFHHDVIIPEGDILIHAGDCTDGGTRNETENFLRWFSSQPHKFKILVPGNHDFYFEKPKLLEKVPSNINLLINEGLVIDGINFWGSPVTPGMENWAFNKERGSQIKQFWDLIPLETDILITHTPPQGILDEISSGLKLGCEELEQTLKVVKPKLHFFGHIHHAAGSTKRLNTKFFNLSILDERHRIMHSPLILDL